MIFFDTETTGLIKTAAPLDVQPRIMELALIKVNSSLVELDRFQVLLNPQMTIPDICVEITGITDDMVAGAPTFAGIVNKLIAFVRGEECWAAHNVEFDREMLVNELSRINWQWRFPYPQVWMDTMQGSGGESLDKWSKRVLGDEYKVQTHRAMADVERMLACWRKYVAET